MKKIQDNQKDAAELRRQAETKLSELRKNAKALPATQADTLRLVHELEVHQIELTMQNEELMQSRAQLEAWLGLYADLYDFAPVGYFTLACDGAIRQVNLTGAKLLGEERGELIKRRFGLFVSVESRSVFTAFMERVFITHRKETCEVTLRKDGAAVLWLHIEATCIEDGEECRAAVMDITERKQAEEALMKSERRLREVQAMARLGDWHWDVKTGHVEWSEEVYKIFHLHPEEFTPHIDSILALSPWPDDHQRNKELINQAIESHAPGFYEQKFLRPDRSIGYYYSTFQGQYDPKGDLISITGSVMDITERKNAEEKIQLAYDRLRRFIDSNIIGVVIASADGTIIETNDYYLNMIGFSREEFESGKVDWRAITPPQWLAADEYAIRELRAKGTCTPYEKEYQRRDGTRVSVLLTDALLPGPAEQIAAFAVDITQRKRMEDALLVSERRLRKFYESGMLGVFYWNRDGQITDANDKFLEMTGYSRVDAAAGRINGYRMTPPEFRDVDELAINELKAKGVNKEPYEKEYIRKDGSRIAIMIAGTLLDREQFNGIAFVLDMTQQKQSLLAQTRLLHILEASLNEIYVFDPISLLFEYVNRGALRNLGYDMEAMQKMTPLDLKPEFTEASFRQTIAPLICREQEQLIFNTVHRRADGSLYPVEIHLQLVEFENHKVFLAVILDITERKRAESEKESALEALHEKEFQYRHLADTGLALIWAAGIDKLCHYFNEPWLRFTGRTLDEEMGNGWTVGVHPDDLDRCVHIYVTAFDKRESFDMEYRLHHVSGEYRWIRDLGTPNYSAGGEFVGYIGHCFDITLQKVAEAQKEEVLEEIRKLNDNLEQKISERTEELRKTIAQLEETNRVFVGRELKMMELKKRIADLEEKK